MKRFYKLIQCRYQMCIAPCFAIFKCVFNVHSIYIQYTFNVRQYTYYLAYANSLPPSLSYPKSRDAIASKNNRGETMI